MKTLLAIIAMLAVGAAWSADPASPPQGPTVSGEVLEAKDVDAYTYLRLKTPTGEAWAAVGKAAVKPGTRVTIVNPTVMTNFESRSLGRKFDRIVFGNLAGTGGGPPAGGDLGLLHAGVTRAPEAADTRVPKAAGADARTVAEVFGSSASLKDKQVTVRARVVKFTPDVMGKNWLHLRDGSGSAADRTNDIVATSNDTAKIGDVVVAKGVVRTDVALGSGYSYKVLLDRVTLQK